MAGKNKPKTDQTTMIAFADLYPTLLSIMGFQQQIPEEVQTFNLASILLCGKETTALSNPTITYSHPIQQQATGDCAPPHIHLLSMQPMER